MFVVVVYVTYVAIKLCENNTVFISHSHATVHHAISEGTWCFFLHQTTALCWVPDSLIHRNSISGHHFCWTKNSPKLHCGTTTSYMLIQLIPVFRLKDFTTVLVYSPVFFLGNREILSSHSHRFEEGQCGLGSLQFPTQGEAVLVEFAVKAVKVKVWRILAPNLVKDT